jgi:hypothetical protein
MKFYNKLIKKPHEINNEEYIQYLKTKESINKLTESIKSLEITVNNYIEILRLNDTTNINISLHKDE